MEPQPMSRKRTSQNQPAIPGMESPPRGYTRRKQFCARPSPDEAAAVVRGALADTLDDSFCNGPLGFALWQSEDLPESAKTFIATMIEHAEDRDRLGMVKTFRRYGLSLFQEIALALFPELYADDPAAVGIVPDGGPERVGRERLELFAAKIGLGKS